VDVAERAEMLIRFVSALDGDFRNQFLIPKPNWPRDEGVVAPEPPADDLPESDPPVILRKSFSNRQELGVRDGHWGCYTEDGGLVLPFTLSHVCSDTAAEAQELFGLELSFSVSADHAPLSNVTIPYLGKKIPESLTGFPHEYNLLLAVRPLAPVPATFAVRVVFTDALGRSHAGALEPFRIELEDMFVPCADAGGVWRAKWRNPFAKLIPMKRDRVERLIAQRLGPFTVTDDVIRSLPAVPEFDFHHELLMHGFAPVESGQLFRERAVVVSLPPEFHLMMRFVMGSHSTIVWIDTDRVELLALLDEFFAQWVPSNSVP
jgi:hypothetical protein